MDAGNQVTINSGRDTTLAGAQVNGNQVTADVGRDLTITSTQDSDHYDSKQNSVSGGVGYTFGAGTASASINASRDRMKSDYDSVQEQSGIFAGDGGFDITVGKHTQLDGAVIASTGSADKTVWIRARWALAISTIRQITKWITGEGSVREAVLVNSSRVIWRTP